MKPSRPYSKLQHELRGLVERDEHAGQRNKISTQLETEFAVAWQLSSDRRRLAYRLGESLRNMPGRQIIGLDHCSYYTGADGRPVIVTQPYGDFAAELNRDLTLSSEMSPEIITANEWAFYYPGHASLFIIKFPHAYAEALAKFKNTAVAAA